MSASNGCHNCVHRYGWVREFWKCDRVGLYTSTEMKFGGRCAHDQELLLWAQRPSLLGRVINLVRINRVAAQEPGAQQGQSSAKGGDAVGGKHG